MKKGLYDLLEEHSASGRIPFHMPGHKRKSEFAGELPYTMDITEIDGFDDLHDSSGVLLELSESMAELWRTNCAFAQCAFPLVCGSTGGILAAIRALTRFGDQVLIDRRSHKSVYNAVELCGLSPSYVYGSVDSEFDIPLAVTAKNISASLDAHPETTLVVITSPTYEGIIADIPAIAEVVHAHGAKLFVDQAHGAHLDLSPYFVGSAIGYADAVVVSLHKTLPTMTQTAALFIAESVDRRAIEAELRVFETSSPSYVLLASIDRCVSLLRSDADRLFCDHSARLERFYKSCRELRHLKLLRREDHDAGKIVISCKNTSIDGIVLAKKLREEHNIEPEMVMPTYVLAMSTLADSDADLSALSIALYEIDRELEFCEFSNNGGAGSIERPEQIMSPHKAARLEGEYIDIKKASGRLSLDYVYSYPPGAPIIAAGELFTDGIVSEICRLADRGLHVCATKGKFPQILVAKVWNNSRSSENML